MDRKRILIIEDDRQICNLLELHLTDMGCSVTCIQNGRAGLEAVRERPPDLLILDVMLPAMDGIDICRHIRSENIDCPIIMLTARSEEIDRVLGLELGADDYITKPFSIRELLARVKAIFRRSEIIEQRFKSGDASRKLEFEGLTIEVDKRKVLRNDARIELSPKEFELLVLLASNPGKSYKRSRLLNLIWGYDFEGYEHTVNSHINRLRAKIEPEMDNPTYILTTWGVGYKFNEDVNL